ncbi:MAG: hypothetical protein VXZ81_04280 [Pseudomonadota bacterium]|nr:hypothetical protein [Pseudomonadota bacterium]
MNKYATLFIVVILIYLPGCSALEKIDDPATVTRELPILESQEDFSFGKNKSHTVLKGFRAKTVQVDGRLAFPFYEGQIRLGLVLDDELCATASDMLALGWGVFLISEQKISPDRVCFKEVK